MAFIPRQVKPPARLAITCKLSEETAGLLKRYAQFLDSTQEYVVNEVLCLTFRRDREFQTWLAANGVTSPAPEPAAASPTRDDDSAPVTRARK